MADPFITRIPLWGLSPLQLMYVVSHQITNDLRTHNMSALVWHARKIAEMAKEVLHADDESSSVDPQEGTSLDF